MNARTSFLRAGTALSALALLLAGCSSASGSAESSESGDQSGAADGPTIAVSARTTDSDFYTLWLSGVKSEAEKLGATLTIYDANGDDSQQILDLQSARATSPDAILVDHGLEGITPAAVEALDAGIPLVSFDSVIDDDRVITVSQSDHDLADLAGNKLVDDAGGTADVIYVYVAGFAPLDLRNEKWTEIKEQNPGINEVAQIGVVNESTVVQVAEQAKASLQENPSVTAIFAPFDDFAKGASQAVRELGLEDTVKVYGADISDADIAVLTEDDSPWVATATTDPSNVGAVSLRTAYLAATGDAPEDDVLIPPALVTGEELRDQGITTVSELVDAFPDLRTDDISAVTK
ncbi:MAG: substrate-binding domain-containing protein [Actinomyces sp.]|jgi:simple sugar transport system substrate-binding protein|nr:substrate-binding domain-containing protein [Actinomyces sp.]MCI1642510.1 substrate-binding domain-containing protein [Actinomyces sp.]MCI1663057.1 substrate-binding domain-containing protein [Actinomyces sp.]MCI1691695.1 substrate-binding domain-containing protein [Actinomyces sp.]MCI1788638.1 substrate-binding domain-containing protein [Actinomyces sp.]MCI1829740.1 substrate-binding domain-containing protein [Actinomyces sp.]